MSLAMSLGACVSRSRRALQKYNLPHILDLNALWLLLHSSEPQATQPEHDARPPQPFQTCASMCHCLHPRLFRLWPSCTFRLTPGTAWGNDTPSTIPCISGALVEARVAHAPDCSLLCGRVPPCGVCVVNLGTPMRFGSASSVASPEATSSPVQG